MLWNALHRRLLNYFPLIGGCTPSSWLVCALGTIMSLDDLIIICLISKIGGFLPSFQCYFHMSCSVVTMLTFRWPWKALNLVEFSDEFSSCFLVQSQLLGSQNKGIKRRHQSPEWMILSHVNCLIQGEVIGFQVHIIWGRPGWLFQFSEGEAVKIFLASVSSCICAMSSSCVALSAGQRCTQDWCFRLIRHYHDTTVKSTTARS